MFSKRQLACMAAVLMGSGLLVLAVSQYNQLSVTVAQSEIARPITEAQVKQSAETLKQMGQTDEQIAALSAEALKTVDEALVKVSNSYWQTILIDAVLGFVFLVLGLMFYDSGRARD